MGKKGIFFAQISNLTDFYHDGYKKKRRIKRYLTLEITFTTFLPKNSQTVRKKCPLLGENCVLIGQISELTDYYYGFNIKIRVLPDTELAGYRAINFAGYRISG